MASALWRLDRIEAMEAALFHKAYKQQQDLLGPDADPNEVRIAAYAEVAESKGFRMVSRHQAQLRRAYEKAWKEIEIIQEQRLQQAAQESGVRRQNEPRIRITPRMVEQYINAPMPRSFGAEPLRATAAGANS